MTQWTPVSDPVHILAAKITPPRIGVPLLVRERLLSAVREGLKRKLLVISSEAGYGKTSLLLSALPDLGMPAAWFTLDESDADPNLFCAGLVAAIRAVAPGFGEPVLKILTTGPSPAELRRGLIAVVDDLPESLVVLDDFHTVDRSDDVVALVDDLLANLPPAVHLIIATRAWPRLPSLPRLLVQGEAVTLDRSALAFTPHEVSGFLRQSHGLLVNDAQADDLARRTEGWPAAVQLAALATRTRGTPVLSGTPREIFDYLATSVVDDLEAPVREFLLRTSILAELWPSLCAVVAPGGAPAAMLEDLTRRNLFLYRLDDASRRFRYHQLFAEFLQQRLSAQNATIVPALHQTAARHLEGETVLDQAVRHYIAAGAFGDAERVMRPLHGDRLNARLAYTFRDLVNHLPDAVLDAYPWMTRCGASASRFVGDYMGGLRLSRRAIAASEGRDPNLWAFSMHGSAAMLAHMDRLEDAVRTCLDALDRLDARVEPRWRNAVLAILANAYLNLGRLREAETVLLRIDPVTTSAAHPGRGITGEYLYAAIASARMQFSQAAKHLQAALVMAYERGSLTNQTLAFTEITALELARHNLPAARNALEHAQALHTQTGERATELELTHLAGTAALLAGNPTDAERFYHLVLERWREGEMQAPRIRAMIGLAAVARQRGNLTEAGALLNASTSLCEQIKLGNILPQIRLQQISLLHERRQFGDAQKILAGLRHTFQEWDAPPGLARVYLWEAALSRTHSGDPRAQEDALAEGLRIGARVGEDFLPFLRDETAWTAPLLTSALGDGIEGDAVESLLAGMGGHAVDALLAALRRPALKSRAISLLGRIGDPRARRTLIRIGQIDAAAKSAVDAALAQLRAPIPVTLRIRLFGTFEVSRDGIKITDAEWKTQKVRQLLKYLLLYRERALPQDTLIETLWPEGEPSAGASNLKTAVKTLRQALEPLQEGSRSSFIVREGAVLRFSDAGRCWIDLDEYDMRFTDAHRDEVAGRTSDAMTALEQAVALYRGDLLEEDRYEDWAVLERERRRERHIEVLESLAALHAQRRDHRKAMETVQHVLALDRLRETAYRALIRYALARGDRPTAIRAYQTCERLLREELGVAPQSETRALYEQARSAAPA